MFPWDMGVRLLEKAIGMAAINDGLDDDSLSTVMEMQENNEILH